MDSGPGRDSVISRASSLLRSIGDAHSDGTTTSELARRAGIPRATAHRLLTALTDEGLVDRSAATGRWMLGPEMYLLGSVAAQRYDIAALSSDVLRDLAQKTGESAFVSARRGDETVCLAEVEGSFPLRSHVLYPGRRLPLGVASAGLVILAHLPDEEIDRHLADDRLVDDWGPNHASSVVRKRLAETRERGFSLNPGQIVEGSWGVGAAVFDSAGQPAWALSLTGVQSRFASDRLPEVGAALIRAAHVLTVRVRRSPDLGTAGR